VSRSCGDEINEADAVPPPPSILGLVYLSTAFFLIFQMGHIWMRDQCLQLPRIKLMSRFLVQRLWPTRLSLFPRYLTAHSIRPIASFRPILDKRLLHSYHSSQDSETYLSDSQWQEEEIIRIRNELWEGINTGRFAIHTCGCREAF
jgi:hypothetical protein